MAAEDFIQDAAPATTGTKKPTYKKYDKNNKGAQIRDQFGNLEYKRKQIDIGLSQPLLPPITRKAIARYRVLPTAGDPDATREIYLDGTYTIFDKFEQDPSKARKQVKNTTGKKIYEKDKNGNSVEVDETEMVIFYNGCITVPQLNKYMTYAFIDLHPRNASNKFRDESVIPEFERIDLSQGKSEAFRLAQEDLQFSAMKEVVEMTDKDDIIGMATAAGIPTLDGNVPRSSSLIKSDLRNFAMNDPRKFFSLSKNTRWAVKMTLVEADSFGVIEYQHQENRWISQVTDEPLITVLVGNDPVDSLVDWVLTEEIGKETYQAIRNILDRWNVKL